MKKITILLVFALLLSIFAGCNMVAEDPSSSSLSFSEESSSIEPAPSVTPEPTPEPSKDGFTDKVLEKPAVVNPLTGLSIGSGDPSARPVAVMINNIKKALPQYGLHDADIIYEIPAEGGITRLLAVFQDPSAVKVIGSVRSARAIFIDVAASYDAIYIHHGGSPEAYQMISNGAVTNLDGMKLEGSMFYRDAWRRSNLGYEHSSMTTGENIAKKLSSMKDKGTRMTCNANGTPFNFVYSDRVPEGAEAVNFTVKTGSYTSEYEYNEKYGVYVRTENGYSKDANGTGELNVRNVFVLQMNYSVVAGDEKGRLKFSNIGSGKGYYISNGHAEEITWKWSSVNSRMQFLDANGGELAVNAGKSFIHFTSKLDNLKLS